MKTEREREREKDLFQLKTNRRESGEGKIQRKAKQTPSCCLGARSDALGLLTESEREGAAVKEPKRNQNTKRDRVRKERGTR